MANNENRRINIYFNNKEEGKTIKAMEAEYRRLNAELKTLAPNTQAYNNKVRELRGVGSQLDIHRDKVKGLNGVWSSITKEVKAFGMIAIGALGVQAITEQIGNLINKTAQLSDAYANIQKTTGLTKVEVEALASELGKMDTRTSRMELLKLAAEAGKLGITGAGNIRKFVEEADKINVALGEDLGEGAILAIGKLSDVFGTGMLNIGSAINSLGAASAASEGYLVDFAARLGGVAKTAGISAPDILGYGAVLDSLGMQAEMSSTALSNFFIEFTKNAGKFESAAGMTKGSLKELIGEKGTNAGFIAFLENLKASSTGADDFLRKLEELGVDGSRGAQVFLTLSNNIGKVKEQQAIANTEFTKGTSIIDEFNVKNETFAAKLEKLKKKLMGFFTNNAFVDGMRQMLTLWSDYLNLPISEKLEEEQAQLNALVTSIIDTNTNQELRNSLIEQLQAEYPDFIGNIDAERISNEFLRDRLAEVNEQYVNRIILQKQQEKLNKQQTKAADEFIKSRENLVNFNKQAAKMEKEFGIDSGADLTMDARMSRLRTVIKARAKENNIFENVGLTWDSGELLGFYEQALQYEQKYQESKYESNKLLEEFQKMQKELNTEVRKIDGKDPLGLGKAFSVNDSKTSTFSSNNKDGSKSLGDVAEKVQRIKQDLIELKTILPDLEPEIAEPMFKAIIPLSNLSDAPFSTPDDAPKTPEQWDELKSKANTALQDISSVGNGILNIVSSVSILQQQELQNFLNAQEVKKEALKDLYDSGRISAADYNKKISALDAESAEKKQDLAKKEARRQKVANIFSSIINTASAVVEALPNIPLAATVGIMGAVNTAMIAAQPTPAFARGGMTTFANGGPVVSPRMGLIGEAGPEWVAPNWMLRNPATADMIGALEAVRKGKGVMAFAEGGSTGEGISNSMGVNYNGELINTIKSLQSTNIMLMRRLQTPIKGVIGWDDTDTRELEEKRSRYSDILNDNTVS